MPHLIAVPGIRAPLPKVDQAGSSGWLGTILWAEVAALGAGGNLSSGGAVAAGAACFDDSLAYLETCGRCFSFQRVVGRDGVQLFCRAALFANQEDRRVFVARMATRDIGVETLDLVPARDRWSAAWRRLRRRDWQAGRMPLTAHRFPAADAVPCVGFSSGAGRVARRALQPRQGRSPHPAGCRACSHGRAYVHQRGPWRSMSDVSSGISSQKRCLSLRR